MKRLVVLALFVVMVAACGAKSGGSTTPAVTDPAQPSGATGGNTYGASAAPSDDATPPDIPSATGEFVDPCAPGE